VTLTGAAFAVVASPTGAEARAFIRPLPPDTPPAAVAAAGAGAGAADDLPARAAHGAGLLATGAAGLPVPEEAEFDCFAGVAPDEEVLGPVAAPTAVAA